MIEQNIGKSVFLVMKMMNLKNLKVFSTDDKPFSSEEDTFEFCLKQHN